MWELAVVAVVLVLIVCVPDASQREQQQRIQRIYDEIDKNTILALLQNEPEYLAMNFRQKKDCLEEALRIWRR